MGRQLLNDQAEDGDRISHGYQRRSPKGESPSDTMRSVLLSASGQDAQSSDSVFAKHVDSIIDQTVLFKSLILISQQV